MRLTALLLAVGLLAAVPAEAQIYSWRDASGTLVLSDRPPAEGIAPRSFEVPGSLVYRSTKPPDRTGRTAYDGLIERHARSQGVSADLVRAVIQVESAFNPRALSPKGAMGLMQLMPGTARDLGVQDAFDPDQNIRGGVAYLRHLLDRFSDDVTLALAAYNAGPGSVERYGDVPPYAETRDYVRKITGATSGPARAPAAVIYKWVEIVDGRPMPRYSNTPPAGVPYEVVGRR